MADINQLIQETARQMGATPLGAVSSDVNCAETDGHTLFYNSSFMNEIESAGGEDGLRFVVAHEMGHQLGGMDKGGHEGEFMADHYATQCLVEMGANFESIQGVFGLLHGMNPHGSETHPAAGTRASRAQGHFESQRRTGVGIEEEILPFERNKRSNPNVKDLEL